MWLYATTKCGIFIPQTHKHTQTYTNIQIQKHTETMKTVGELIKLKRMERELTLRNFCEKAKLDPSNWSKIERGLLESPKSLEVLENISGVLEMSDDEFQLLKDLAVIESIPKSIKPDQEILESLPVFFRTVRDNKPDSEEKLKSLIQIIKNS